MAVVDTAIDRRTLPRKHGDESTLASEANRVALVNRVAGEVRRTTNLGASAQVAVSCGPDLSLLALLSAREFEALKPSAGDKVQAALAEGVVSAWLSEIDNGLQKKIA